MNKIKKLAVIIGTRPNIIKVAPFLRRAEEYANYKLTTIYTGQHYTANLSTIFFRQMKIRPPDIIFKLDDAPYAERIAFSIRNLKNHFKNNVYDGLITFGDVDSTLAGALSAIKFNPAIAHIEAGLRSWDRRMPEETNRLIVDHLSDLLFTTEESANANLIKEGCEPEKIKHVGNIMIETLELYLPQIKRSTILTKLKLRHKKYFVATIHRRENILDRETLKNILLLLNSISTEKTVVLPVHPSARASIDHFGLKDLLAPLRVIEPLGYFDFVQLMLGSRGVITDSGGLQEETSHLGIPCATLRDNTERPITLTLGSNKLFAPANPDPNAILTHLARKDFIPKQIPLWDGLVSERIFKHLNEYFYD